MVVETPEPCDFNFPDDNRDYFISRKTTPLLKSEPTEDIIGYIDKKLAISKSFAAESGSQKVILCGLVGSGKFEICLRYAHQHRAKYRYVFCLDAMASEGLETQFMNLGTTLGHKQEILGELDIETTLLEVRNHLTRLKDRFLLIFRNALNLAQIKDYLPNKGHILITSIRNEGWPELAKIPIGPMHEDEAEALIKQTLNPPNSNLEKKEYKDKGAILELTHSLSGNPQALVQACVLIRERPDRNIRGYLYSSSDPSFIEGGLPETDHTPKEVSASFAEIRKHLKEKNKNALIVLDCIAFLASTHIPKNILRHILFENKDSKKSFLTEQETQIGNAIKELENFWLLKDAIHDPSAQDKVYYTPLVVRSITRAILDINIRLKILKRLCIRMSHAHNHMTLDDSKSGIEAYKLLSVHFKCLYQELRLQSNIAITETQESALAYAAFLRAYGNLLIFFSCYQKALLVLGEAFILQEKYLKDISDAGTTAETMNKKSALEQECAETLLALGLLHFKQGNFDAARKQLFLARDLYKQLIERNFLARSELSYIKCIRLIAHTYNQPEEILESQYEVAERWYKIALHLLNDQDVPEKLEILHGLSALYLRQKKTEEAERHYRQVIESGTKNNITIKALFNLGTIRWEQGNYTEAADYLAKAYEIQKIYYPNGHGDIATITLPHLGSLAELCGHYDHMIAYRRAALEMTKLFYENDDIVYGERLAEWGQVCLRFGYLERAQRYFRAALDIFKKKEKESLPIAEAQLVLADSYYEEERYGKVRGIIKEVIAIRTECMSTLTDFDIAEELFLSAKALAHQNHQKNLAIQTASRAFNALCEHYPPRHMMTAYAHVEFAIVNYLCSKYEKAITYFEEALPIQEDFFGKNHLRVGYTKMHWAITLFNNNDYQRALTLAEDAQKIFISYQHVLYRDKIKAVLAEIHTAINNNARVNSETTELAPLAIELPWLHIMNAYSPLSTVEIEPRTPVSPTFSPPLTE